MAALSLSLSVRHDFGSHAERFEKYPDELDRATVNATRRATDTVEDAYKQTIPRRTGRTADTITSVVEPKPGGATGYVGTNDEIAGYLEYGTRPHVIRAKNAKALGPMQIGNKERFFVSVNHPGTSAHDSLLRAATASIPRVERHYEDEWGEVFR